jgi:hypothetical protein
VTPAHRAAAAAAFLILTALPVRAQVQVGTEFARERATYHFDVPSSFDTAFLVPHFFEQYYVLDNLWVNAAAGYRAGIDWTTSAGVTTERQSLATDYDTFFNPGGVTWVAGTTGDARIRSWRLEQQVRVGRAGPLTFTGGYRVRVDRANFLAGDRTEVRNDVVVRRDTVTTREYTSVQRHEVYVGARLSADLPNGWQLAGSGDVSPAAVHRLAVELPDKYPGTTLVYRTTALTIHARAEVRRARTRWPVAVFVQAGSTINYHGDQRVSRQSVAGGITVGRVW